MSESVSFCVTEMLLQLKKRRVGEDLNCKHCGKMGKKDTLYEDIMNFVILTITSSGVMKSNNFMNNIINEI